MESAGFSRSNPYYIVKQGKVNELATASDSYRLQLLREVAGTRVYDEKKQESLELLTSSKDKNKKCEEFIKIITNRLKELEAETNELKEYQRLDKDKRALEYSLAEHELNEVTKQSNKLNEDRHNLNNNSQKVTADFAKVQGDIATYSAEKRRLEARFKGLREEKETLEFERSSLMERRSNLKVMIEDLNSEVEKEKNARADASNELTEIRAEIENKEKELNELKPKLAELTENELKLQTKIRVTEAHIKELMGKQQFKDENEKNAVLDKEHERLRKQKDDTKERLDQFKKSLEEMDEELEMLTNKVNTKYRVELSRLKDHISNGNQTMTDKRRDYENTIAKKLDSSRQSTSIRDQINQTEQEIATYEDQLRRCSNRGAYNGMVGVKKIVEELKRNPRNTQEKNGVEGYYGTVMELFEVPAHFYQAIEVTAGNRLFAHVVKDDTVAQYLLKKFNDHNYPGEPVFMPLNRLNPGPEKELPNENRSEVRPLIELLDFDAAHEKVFRLIFGSTALIRKMDPNVTRILKNHGFDCITMDGTQVSLRGTMTGGYLDPKKIKLDIYNNIREQKKQKEQLDRSLKESEEKTANLMKEADEFRKLLDDTEHDVRVVRMEYQEMYEKNRRATERIGELHRAKQPRETEIKRFENLIDEVTKKMQFNRSLRQNPFQGALSSEENEQVKELQKAMHDDTENLRKVVEKRTRVEKDKNQVENMLSSHLYRVRDNLQANTDDIGVSQKRDDLSAETAELILVNKRHTFFEFYQILPN
ncbi:hypothetical protein WR25_00926 [Diploscapter pachys]|uniref:SMC hinge domain-containing protein n=1 Tax=Diploscapter pachys TaxID=2018661 RepID=A0A2A2KVQ0_9BILA|nr:hypothetical protein WR25_00926 [Diploscapter pachys]